MKNENMHKLIGLDRLECEGCNKPCNKRHLVVIHEFGDQKEIINKEHTSTNCIYAKELTQEQLDETNQEISKLLNN
jgi:hypothetical protein